MFSNFDVYDFGVLAGASVLCASVSYQDTKYHSKTSCVVLALSFVVDSFAMVCFRHKNWKVGGACLLLSQIGLGCRLRYVDKKKVLNIFFLCFGGVCLAGLAVGGQYGVLRLVSWARK